jgi:hypothetical protein
LPVLSVEHYAQSAGRGTLAWGILSFGTYRWSWCGCAKNSAINLATFQEL